MKISNGIDLSKVKLLKTSLPKIKDEVIFVGVARLSFWHGYDRMIKSIAEYRGAFNIKLYIVGDGEPELTKLKEMTNNLKLNSKVFFLGALYGSDLDKIYLSSTICIDSLGRHRSGNTYNSSLKSKEYIAKGLPFIKSHKDESFEGESFVYNASPDDDNINLDSVIEWYVNLPADTPLKMRAFAEAYLSWQVQCQKIIDAI